MAILEIVKVTKSFGGLQALTDVDLSVEPGDLVGLIGPNGAGKTTLFNVISGVIPASSGKVIFLGENITGVKTHQIAAKGLVRTFQATRLFMNLSVVENIELAFHIPAKANVIKDVFGLSPGEQRSHEIGDNALEIIKLAGLEKVRNELAKNLPHGYQRALGVAAAFAAGPKLLCLDEPVTGMNAEETQFMMDFIKRMQQRGTTILLIEHSMRVVMGICSKIAVLNFGRKIAEGTCREIQSNKDVIEAYLGKGEEDAS